MGGAAARGALRAAGRAGPVRASRPGSAASCCDRSWSRAATSACTSTTAPSPASSTRCRCCTRTAACGATTSSSPTRTATAPHSSARASTTARSSTGSTARCSHQVGHRRGFEVEFAPFRHRQGHEHRDDDGPGARLMAMPAPCLPDDGRRFVLGARVVGAAEERLLPAAVERAPPAEIHDVAIKAALKDQELAGIDVVSDGELRRDNDVDYLLARIPGIDVLDRLEGLLLRLLRRRGRPTVAAGRRDGARAGRRVPVHGRPHGPADQVLLHRPVLVVPAGAQRRLRRRRRSRARAGRRAERRGARAGRRRRDAAADRRAVPGRVPRAGRAWRSRRSTS